MMLRIRFPGLEGVVCSEAKGKGGIVTEWDFASPPVVARGRWEPDGSGKGFGGTVVCEGEPGQLIFYGRSMPRKSWRSFGLAWRDSDGTLIGQPISGQFGLAEAIFQAGRFEEPWNDVDEAIGEMTRAAKAGNTAQLLAKLAEYMEAHLLIGAPVRSGDDPIDLGLLAERLARTAWYWPEYAEVLETAILLLKSS